MRVYYQNPRSIAVKRLHLRSCIYLSIIVLLSSVVVNISLLCAFFHICGDMCGFFSVKVNILCFTLCHIYINIYSQLCLRKKTPCCQNILRKIKVINVDDYHYHYFVFRRKFLFILIFFSPGGVDQSRRYCNTGPIRGKGGASPQHFAMCQKSV